MEVRLRPHPGPHRSRFGGGGHVAPAQIAVHPNAVARMQSEPSTNFSSAPNPVKNVRSASTVCRGSPQRCTAIPPMKQKRQFSFSQNDCSADAASYTRVSILLGRANAVVRLNRSFYHDHLEDVEKKSY